MHLLKAMTLEKVTSVKALVSSQEQVLAAEEQANGRKSGGEGGALPGT